MVHVAQQERPLVQLTPLKKELAMSFERRDDKVSTGGVSRESESDITQGLIRLSTEGDVYHPNLMTFAAGLGWGFFRQDYTFNDVSDHATGFLSEYSLQTNILQRKEYPSTFYLNQKDDLLARQFLGPIRVKSSNMGWVTYLRLEDWPMSLSWSETELKQDSEVSGIFVFFRRDTRRLGYSVTHDFSDRSSLGFRFDWDQTDQTSVGNKTDIDKKNYAVDHRFKFSNERQHNLNSYVTFIDQGGVFDASTLDWNERLLFNHSPNFQTFYELKYNDYAYESTSSDRIRGNMGFRHRLY